MKHIISGGQTGADRAALDWAIKFGIPHSGWCPKGRRAEDGRIPDIYQLCETETSDYKPRTLKNILNSDATVIFTVTFKMGPGSMLTQKLCRKHGKKYIHLHEFMPRAFDRLSNFICFARVNALNVAGSRASQAPGIYEFVYNTLHEAKIRIECQPVIHNYCHTCFTTIRANQDWCGECGSNDADE